MSKVNWQNIYSPPYLYLNDDPNQTEFEAKFGFRDYQHGDGSFDEDGPVGKTMLAVLTVCMFLVMGIYHRIIGYTGPIS